MKIEELFRVQEDSNKLKSLYVELEDLSHANPYKKNDLSGMPSGGNGKEFAVWYTEQKERIEHEIRYCKEKLKADRELLEGLIANAPFPECDIIRYRIVNHLGWFEIGDILAMDRRTASRKFYKYLNANLKDL